MTWQRHDVFFTPEAERDLGRLDRDFGIRIRNAIDRYAETGHGDVKRLQGVDRQWRLRVGDWRVLFTLDEGRLIVILLRVLPRGSAYR